VKHFFLPWRKRSFRKPLGAVKGEIEADLLPKVFLSEFDYFCFF
jgi:hypothetical protein